MSRRHLSLALCVALSAGAVGAQSKAKDQNMRRDHSSMTKVAMAFGGSYGRGAMVCRSGKAFDGSWGAPAI